MERDIASMQGVTKASVTINLPESTNTVYASDQTASVSIMPVSYTHLDVYKRQDLYRMKEDALAVFRRRKIGFVCQAFNLVSSVNVWENIVLPLGLDGRKVDEAYRCV